MSGQRAADHPVVPASHAGDSREYSRRLGVITSTQFQAALDRFVLGQFISAEPITLGNWGQNCFLTSSAGEFVLRGNPFYSWQFLAEQFFARWLHERTAVQVPWPYYVEPSSGLFGWSYAVMRRLPGQPLADNTFRSALHPESRRLIARSMGETLAALQNLQWPVSGTYDPATGDIRPSDAHDPAAEAHVLRGPPPGLDTPAYIRHLLARARREAPEHTTAADEQWVEHLIAEAREALQVPFSPCFVMVDFQENNVVVTPGTQGIPADPPDNPDTVRAGRGSVGAGWRVGGVFDLHGTFFGDGEKALARQTAGYLSDSARARAFLTAYFARRPPRPGFAQRLQLYVLAQALPVWLWRNPSNTPTMDRTLTLRDATGLTSDAWQELLAWIG
jgi:aminoglycoside phosphotransferase (APT) family kinase protein